MGQDKVDQHAQTLGYETKQAGPASKRDLIAAAFNDNPDLYQEVLYAQEKYGWAFALKFLNEHVGLDVRSEDTVKAAYSIYLDG